MSCFQRFTQYLASSNSNFQLANFLDKTGVQGKEGRGVTRERERSSLNSLEKIHGALAQAVYMDPGVKINYERTKALGNGVESLGL